jgi:hypothetical protein
MYSNNFIVPLLLLVAGSTIPRILRDRGRVVQFAGQQRRPHCRTLAGRHAGGRKGSVGRIS